MPSTLAELLKLVGAVVMTIVLIGLAIMIFTPGADQLKSANTDNINAITQLKDQKFTLYDNTTISGSQVSNALRDFEKAAKDQSIALFVKTGKNTAGTWYYSSFAGDAVSNTGASDNVANTINPTHIEYINPSGLFEAKIARDTNGVIRSITFIQQRSF